MNGTQAPSLPSSAASQAHERHLQTLNGQFIGHNESLGEMLFHLDGQISVLLSVKHHTHYTADGQKGQPIFLSKHLCHWRGKAKREIMKTVNYRNKERLGHLPAVLSLTSGFSRFGWSNNSQFNRQRRGGLWLPEILQGVQHKCVAVLLRCKEVDMLMEDEGICGIEWPLQRLDQISLFVLL